MIPCRWVFTGVAHRVRHHAHRLGHHPHRHHRRHRAAWRWVCVATGAPLILGGGAGAGWAIGSARTWWMGTPTVRGVGLADGAWAAAPAVHAVPEPGTLALVGLAVLFALAVRP